MKNLEWCDLAERFYAFKTVADRLGFYVPETAGMEASLYECRPFVADAEVAGKIRTLNEGKALNIDFSELMGAESPVYDDNDELAHA
ncbi:MULTISPECIES: hypothetical protein [Selenomonas]|jgi:hypothetical protein|uniref:Uncharacterized protein n=1 Tax=Selenomonas ruminantium TaxID=971 RepID=A0A1K1M0T6_SELRU|nr:MULTISPECIES: hypothetical protein [Selenomonas]MBE6084740.1 hypothetical protein [Selenomonas ruminantium]SEA11416.1 hypothetical protein SAMN05660648_02008 [Selenomonas ruminantium]SFA73421.1 hypothetical protein SAMN05216587_101440 [Selenomonas ruminantium]SFW16719.1 hypothetical protein SAMN02910323_0497 [Selenomonas ruminantium]